MGTVPELQVTGLSQRKRAFSLSGGDGFFSSVHDNQKLISRQSHLDYKKCTPRL